MKLIDEKQILERKGWSLELLEINIHNIGFKIVKKENFINSKFLKTKVKFYYLKDIETIESRSMFRLMSNGDTSDMDYQEVIEGLRDKYAILPDKHQIVKNGKWVMDYEKVLRLALEALDKDKKLTVIVNENGYHLQDKDAHKFMVNFLRHSSVYHKMLRNIQGKPGSEILYSIIKEKILIGIMEYYPLLKDECVRQISNLNRRNK